MENNSAWFLEQMKPCTKKKKLVGCTLKDIWERKRIMGWGVGDKHLKNHCMLKAHNTNPKSSNKGNL